MDRSEDGRRTLGLILAGGLARRMGGGDKGLAPLARRPVLERVRDRLAPQVEGLVLNANGDPSRFAALGLTVLPDTVPDCPGPLAGVLAGLAHAGSTGDFGWLVTVPCDAPFLPADLVSRLHEACAQGEGTGAVAVSGGRRHPTVALWPLAAAGAVQDLLSRREHRVGAALSRLGFSEAHWPDRPHDPFLNINEPADLAAAEELLRSAPEA